MPRYHDVETDDYKVYARPSGRWRILKYWPYRSGKIKFELHIKNKTDQAQDHHYWFVISRRTNGGTTEVIPWSDNKLVEIAPYGEYKEILEHQRLINYGYDFLLFAISGKKDVLVEFEIPKVADVQIAQWKQRVFWLFIGAIIGALVYGLFTYL